MNTDTLIATLAEDVAPVPRHAAGRRLLLGMLGGGAVTLVLVAVVLGFRRDLEPAMQGFSFWMKGGYTIALGIVAVMLVGRLARPDTARVPLWPLAVPFVVLAMVAGIEVATAPPGDWLAMWLGATWTKCPWLVLMLSVPIFVGLLWSFRRLAPTRLRVAGAVAGVAAGAWAATLYGLHCPEVSALFVLSWYTLGIALAGAMGAWIGPRFLRW